MLTHPMRTGLKLGGRYAVVDDRGGREVVSIAFTPDGRFTESGLIKPTNLIVPSTESDRRKKLGLRGGSGTYSVAGNINRIDLQRVR